MLTRKMLKAMGIEEEKIEQIIEAHTESTDALKEERDRYKGEVETLKAETETLKESANEETKKIEDVEKERDKYKALAEENESYKEMYDKEHEAFEEYKSNVDAEKVEASKANAYKSLLKKAGVSDKRIDAIMKVPFEVELDEKGNIKDADKVIENIKEEWSDFIVTEKTKGAGTEQPPKNTGGSMTKEEIMAIKDRAKRQEAISENHELFGY